jgi:hypothetical protein
MRTWRYVQVTFMLSSFFHLLLGLSYSFSYGMIVLVEVAREEEVGLVRGARLVGESTCQRRSTIRGSCRQGECSRGTVDSESCCQGGCGFLKQVKVWISFRVQILGSRAVTGDRGSGSVGASRQVGSGYAPVRKFAKPNLSSPCVSRIATYLPR